MNNGKNSCRQSITHCCYTDDNYFDIEIENEIVSKLNDDKDNEENITKDRIIDEDNI